MNDVSPGWPLGRARVFYCRGMGLSAHPPHRSRRAALPHRALASGDDAEASQEKKGGGKANIALARKLLEIIYRALKNDCIFEDFGRFRLEGGICPVKAKRRVG